MVLQRQCSKKHIFLVLFLSLTYVFNIKAFETQSVKVVEAQKVECGIIQEIVNLIGKIQPKHYIEFKSDVSGTIEYLVQGEGLIKKGTAIAKILNPETEFSYKLLEEVEKISREAYYRAIKLAENKAVSKQAIEELNSKWIIAQKNKNSIFEKLFIVSPFDGVIGFKRNGFINKGELFLNFYQRGSFNIEFDIPRAIAYKISKGQKVFIKGKQLEISYLSNISQPENHSYIAYVESKDFTDSDIGAYIDIELIADEHKNSLIIPESAVFINNSKFCVYVAQDNKVRLVEIKTGIKQEGKVEVVEGLVKDQMVVVKNPERLYDGENVKIE
jgi:membrane fusion protein, multidrug efflux system